MFQKIFIRNGCVKVEAAALDDLTEFFDGVEVLKKGVEIASVSELLKASRELMWDNNRRLSSWVGWMSKGLVIKGQTYDLGPFQRVP